MRINLHYLNREWAGLDAIERIRQARFVHFHETLIMGSHFNGESALGIDLMLEVDPSIRIVHVRESEASTYLDTYRSWFEKNRGRTLDIVIEDRLPDEMKLDALRRAIARAKGSAIMHFIRADQTDVRAQARFVEYGTDGIYRVNPILDWNRERVYAELDRRGLPYVKAGEKSECGIHCYERASS